MASIERRGENSYRITVSDGYNSQGKQIKRRKTVTLDPGLTERQKEKEIQRLAVEFERQVQTGQFLEGNITLKSFVDRWLEEYAKKQLQPKTLDSYKLELNSKILPALGHLRLDKIQPIHILDFLNNLLEDGVRKDGKPGGYSDRTVKYQHQILSSILQTAVYWQVIISNPCERVKVPKNENKTYKDKTKIKHFTEEQTIRFLELAKDKVEQNMQRLQYRDLWDKNWENNKLLFTQWNGVVMSYTTPFQWFKKVIRKYNKSIKYNKDIPDKEKLYLPEIPFHGLRHTSATLLISEKVDVKTISSRLGHTQTSTTTDIYSHSLRTTDKKAASALENLLSKNKEINPMQAKNLLFLFLYIPFAIFNSK